MLCREIIAFYSEIHNVWTKRRIFFYLKPGGTYSNHWGFKGESPVRTNKLKPEGYVACSSSVASSKGHVTPYTLL